MSPKNFRPRFCRFTTCVHCLFRALWHLPSILCNRLAFHSLMPHGRVRRVKEIHIPKPRVLIFFFLLTLCIYALFKIMHSSLVLLQVTTMFGFICATINTTMVPSDANIVDIHLVSIQGTTLFGSIFATINTTMVPNNVNIVDIHLVLLQVTSVFGFMCATINIAMMPNNSNIMLICHVSLK